jgi:hypothetical protein
MYPHRIRLRGPWECEPLARLVRHADGRVETLTQPLPPRCRMILPCRWSAGGLGEFTGRARFTRRFGIPRQIDSYEQVWLTFAGVDPAADVWLNGQSLGRCQSLGPCAFEVTAQLLERNLLTVEVESDTSDGGLWGEVALEIRRTAYLNQVRLWADYAEEAVQLHASGEVVGSSAEQLEVYVILDRSTVAYSLVEPGGTAFHLISEPLAVECLQKTHDSRGQHLVRVELVGGASIWYAVEQEFVIREGG